MLKRYFVTGLLLWVPLVITVWVLGLIVGTMDKSLALLPAQWQPRVWLGHDIPGVGVVLTVLVVFITGLLTTNFIGQALVGLGERILARIPVVRTLYSSVKQVSDTILSPHGQAFRKALLVEYPRRGSWTIAFLTGEPSAPLQATMLAAQDAAAKEVVTKDVDAQAAGVRDAGAQAAVVKEAAARAVQTGPEPDAGEEGEMISVFVPTTPNPTSGFFLMMRRSETVELDMSVDAALKYIVSMGVVVPVMDASASPGK